MKAPTLFLLFPILLILLTVPSHAGFFDDLTKGIGSSGTSTIGLDDSTIAKGLKEALATGTSRAVGSVSRPDGYFSNEAIKILMPEKIRNVADILGKFGFQQEVDNFVLSMNRAAEKAAPKAKEHFVSALKEMSFEDARGILAGGNSAATDYFRKTTGDKIYASFKPVVTANMKDTGVVRNYSQMMDRFAAIPFVGTASSFDLGHYVTTKAVDGLFSMLAVEENKIRTDPAARGTQLLKKVFGR
ncbi:DUF4197 domain-containing protein [Pelotalea chapellei]|uniref:DUF4197 family protein n=1 Tax=Pelotalea chapellei TaxID=44671 RepID=A0ABS5UBZ2_9BACT|nr:DUF4197 domain-containing protein [Pelotalea chapellei]MBT1073192.1 DUF4197 family protein [Pelotalea chapellei]